MFLSSFPIFLSYVMIVAAPDAGRAIIGIVGFLVFALVPAFAIARLMSHKALIRIDERGVYSRRWSDDVIAWEDIDFVEECPLRRDDPGPAHCYWVHLRDPQKYPQSGKPGGMARRPVALPVGCIALSLIGTNRRGAELANAISQYLPICTGRRLIHFGFDVTDAVAVDIGSPFVARRNPIPLAALILIFAILFGLSLLLAFTASDFDGTTTGIAGLLIFGLLAAFALVRLRLRKPVIRIDEHGIYWRGWSDDIVPWEDIDFVEPGELPCIRIHLRHPRELPRSVTSGESTGCHVSYFELNAFGTDRDPDEVVDAILQRLPRQN